MLLRLFFLTETKPDCVVKIGLTCPCDEATDATNSRRGIKCERNSGRKRKGARYTNSGIFYRCIFRLSTLFASFHGLSEMLVVVAAIFFLSVCGQVIASALQAEMYIQAQRGGLRSGWSRLPSELRVLDGSTESGSGRVFLLSLAGQIYGPRCNCLCQHNH